MQTQIVNLISPRFGAPYGLQSYLLPPGFATGPIEGPWVRIDAAKSASLEVAGALGGGTLALQLVGTNDPAAQDKNNYVITIAGTVANGDTFTATFSNPGLSAPEVVTVTAGGSDTPATIGPALATAINADQNLNNLGISASAAAGVVTVEFPSISPQSGNPSASPEGAGGTPAYANFTTVAGTKVSTSGTIAVANGSNGTNLGSAISALGLTAIAAPLPLFIKARMTLTGATGANVTASLNAST